jgi:hypothetical protein
MVPLVILRYCVETCSKKNTQVLLVAGSIQVGLDVNTKHDRQWTYNVTMGRIRATIVTVEKQ